MVSRFLFNAALWEELKVRIPKARMVRAAVAYMGTGGASLLPLRKGDRFVVDMSLRAVKSGVTDPREIRKLLRRGVRVFSRASLHAKFFVIGKTLIAGSSNISKHARDTLDEAGILTSDPATVTTAQETFDRLCTEPVRTDYLEKCIAAYRPAKFGGARTIGPRPSQRVVQGKLWLIGSLTYGELREEELAPVEAKMNSARSRLLDFERSEVDYLRYPSERAFFGKLHEGDWTIQCFRAARGLDVWPPARFLGTERVSTRSSARVLLFEFPPDAVPVSWSTFRAALPSSISAKVRNAPRTRPITRDADADAILALWDDTGRWRGRQK